MGLLSVPKSYTPRKGGKKFPREDLIYASKAEQGLLRAMTDGRSNMTKHGVPSFYMEGGTGTRGTSGIGTSSRGTSSAGRTSSNTNSGSSGTGGSTNQGRGGSPVGGGTTDRSFGGGGGNTNRGNTGTGGPNNPGRGGSSPGGGLGFGRDPAMGSRGVPASSVRGIGPQYSGPARYNQPFNANRSQQTFGGYPNSMAGMMPGQLNGFASPNVNPMAPQAMASTFPARPGVIAENNISTPPAVSAMKKARQSTFPARPGVIAANNVYSPPEVSAIKREREFASTFPARPESPWSNIADIADAPIPRQNPLSDTSKFTFDPKRPRDSIFAGADQEAISRLVSMQENYGSPFRITSGYRSPAFNKKVEGAKKSQHLQGKAFDVHTDDPSAANYARLAQAADQAGFTGLGAYRPGSLHVDTGPLRSWGPSEGSVMAAISGPRATMATAPAPPKATVMRNVVAPAIQGIRNMISPPSIPKPQPNPMRNRMATINPAGSTWTDDQPVNINPSSQEAIDRASWANMQAQNDVGPQPPETDLYARQNKIQQIASSIMDHLPGGSGGRPSGRGDFGKGGNRDDSGRNGGSGNGTAPPPVTPPPAPPVNPMTPWLYPQYQSQWAGLPQGIGGYARG